MNSHCHTWVHLHATSFWLQDSEQSSEPRGENRSAERVGPVQPQIFERSERRKTVVVSMQSSDTRQKPLWRELQDLVAPKNMKDFAHSNSMHEWRCAFVIFLARKPVAVILLRHSDLMSIKLRCANWLNRAVDKSQSWKKYSTQWVTVLKIILSYAAKSGQLCHGAALFSSED